MTGHQEHPGTGRRLDHQPTNKLVLEDLVRAAGVRRVHVIEPHAGSDEFDRLLAESLDSGELVVIIARRPCILIASQLKEYARLESAKSGHAETNPLPCPVPMP